NILESDHNQFMLHAPGWSPHGVVKSQRSLKTTRPSGYDVLKAGIQRTPAFSMRYVLIEVASLTSTTTGFLDGLFLFFSVVAIRIREPWVANDRTVTVY